MTEIIKTLVALAKKRMTQHEKAQKGKILKPWKRS